MENAASEGQDKSVLVLSEQLFPVLDEADEDDHGRPRQPDKKHDFKQPHCKDSQLHKHDCSVFWTCPAAVYVLKRGRARRFGWESNLKIVRNGDNSRPRLLPDEKPSGIRVHPCARGQNAIDSALYAASILEFGGLEVVGRRRTFRRLARVAVSAGGAAARLA